jgi:hypothetical protein
MTRANWFLWIAAAGAGVLALYCYSGYAMNVSLSVGPDDQEHYRGALFWLAGSVVCLLVAFALGVAAWRRRVRGTDR